ncbi:uncharacterized protein LOC141913381 [Tubulanus polymorphus]|uniref:uncharacterized protein LOC141913381 n=1 Tax=Tubulanus polymorphus TaxID=672921 RepID=UPI003DA59B8F
MIGSCSLFCLQENEENGGKSGGYSFTNCTAEILQHRPIKDIRSELIQSTIQTHHDTYVCGVKTLHFLINAWLDKSLKLLQQGVPVFDVCEGLHEGIHECIKNLENISIKIRLDNTENHESIFITSCNLQTDDLTLPIEDLPAPEDLPPSEILPLPTQVFLPPPTEILPHPPEIPFPADILPPPTDILPPPFEDLPAPEDLPPTEFLPPPTEILPPPNEDLSAPGDLPATEILPHWIEDLPPPIEDFPAPFAPSSNTAINNTELSTSSPPTRGQSNEEERGISDDDSDDDDDDDEFVSCLDLTKSGDVLFNLRNIEKRIKTSGFNDNQFTSSNSIQTSSVEPSGVQLSGVQPSSVQPSSNLPSSVQSSSNLLSSVQPSGTLAPTTPPSNVDFPPPYSDLPTQIVDLLPQNDEVPFQVPSAPLNLNSLPPPFNSPLNLNSLPLPPPPLNSAPLNLNSLPPPLNSPLNLNRRDIAAGLNHEYEDEFDACFDDRGKKSTETGKTCELRKLSVGQKIHDDDVFLENTSTTTPSINDLINEKIKFKRPIVTKMSRHYRSENGSDPYSTRQPDAYNSRQPDTYSSYQPDTYSTCQPGAYNSRQPNTYRQPDTDSIRQLDAYNSCQPDTYDSRQPDTYNSRQPDTYSSHHSPDTYSMHHPPDTYSMHHPPDTSERAEHMIYTSSNRKFIGRERVVTSRSLKSSKSSPNILRSKTPELTRRRFEIGKSSKSLNNDDSSSSSGGGGGVQRRGVEKRRVDTRVDSGYHGDTTRSKSLAILNLDSSSIRDESFSTIFTRICDSLIERVKNESLKLENRIVKTQASFNSKLDATFQTMVDSFHDDKDVSASKSERSSESFTGDMDAFRHQGALDVHAIYEQFFMKLNGKSVTAESRESPGTTESTWWESAGNVSVATESTGRESLERESVWRESRGRQSAWRESVGRESTGRESVGRESAWRESVGRESTGRESVGRESAWRESGIIG